MISSVSSVSFKATAPEYDLARPGKYANTQQTQPEIKKENNHKALKWIAGIVASVIAISAFLAVGAKQGWFKSLAEEELQNANIGSKLSHHACKAGDAIKLKVEKYVDNVQDFSKRVFNKEKAPKAE